jgi:hypothetical protein
MRQRLIVVRYLSVEPLAEAKTVVDLIKALKRRNRSNQTENIKLI